MNEDLTIREYRSCMRQVELEISMMLTAIISKFKEKTGASVTHVDIELLDVRGSLQPIIGKVRLTTSIDLG